MINAGAILCASLVQPELSSADRFDYVRLYLFYSLLFLYYFIFIILFYYFYWSNLYTTIVDRLSTKSNQSLAVNLSASVIQHFCPNVNQRFVTMHWRFSCKSTRQVDDEVTLLTCN